MDFPGFDFGCGMIIGQGEQLRAVFRAVESLAESASPVLIQGERGTGKSLAARAIHFSGPHADKPLVNVSGMNIFRYLIEKTGETEPKGHLPNPFQASAGGTLVLEDIAYLPLSAQTRLCEIFFPESSPAALAKGIRLLVLSDMPLTKAVRRGEILPPLWERLAACAIQLPALREIKEEIPILAQYFVIKYSHKNQKNITGLSPETLPLLMRYSWPGNIRELESTMEEAVMMEGMELLQPYNLPYEVLQKGQVTGYSPREGGNLRESLRLFERQMILRTLNESAWKKSEAAERLGIDQRNLAYFLKKHHITDPLTRMQQRGEPST